MRTYVLIGGIGSGKSTVSRMLNELGAQCIDLDQVGHEVLTDPEATRELVDAFGEAILNPAGGIDRRALAMRAFASPDATQLLNGITQPRIVQRASQLLHDFESQGCDMAVVEISPFDGPEGVFAPLVQVADGIVAVIAPEEMRVQRAVARGFAESDVRARMSRQATDDERAAWSDMVLRNAGTEDDLRDSVRLAWDSMHG